MKITIRKARKTDIKHLIRLYVESANEIRRMNPTYYKKGEETVPSYRNYLLDVFANRSSRVVVAITPEKEVVGYGIASLESRQFYMSRKYGWVSDITVSKDYRKLGISKKIMKDLFAWFKKHDIKRVELFVDVKNKVAVKVWQKHGFKEHMRMLYKRIR